MSIKRKKCTNGCLLPKQRVSLIKKNGEYTFGMHNFNFCPKCGDLMPEALNKTQAFFDIYYLNNNLESAKRLLYKSEFTSAAREAFVTVENAIKAKSGLDLHGADLAAKALSFTYDNENGLIKSPLIAINDLTTESKRNEQKGLQLLIMGFFTGQRNLYIHNDVSTSNTNVISILYEASFILNLLDGQSLTEKGRWIKDNISYSDINRNMPKLSDKLRLRVYRFMHKRLHS